VIPGEFAVNVSPNPFNPRTSVELALPVDGRARVDIYDVRGRLVRKLLDEDLPAGNHSRTWEGQDDRGQRVASGVYMVKVQHPGGSRVTKVSLVE
jgi:flagellar hook assembly protein FlgD